MREFWGLKTHRRGTVAHDHFFCKSGGRRVSDSTPRAVIKRAADDHILGQHRSEAMRTSEEGEMAEVLEVELWNRRIAGEAKRGKGGSQGPVLSSADVFLYGGKAQTPASLRSRDVSMTDRQLPSNRRTGISKRISL